MCVCVCVGVCVCVYECVCVELGGIREYIVCIVEGVSLN